MFVRKRTFFGVLVILIALILIISSAAALYYVKYTQVYNDNLIYVRQLDQLGAKYDANILIDYGNGSSEWYNNTAVQPGTNLYTATVLAASGNVNATYSAQYQEHLVNGIAGLEATGSEFWWLWTYEKSNSTSQWQVAQLGSDQITVTNGGIYAWTFCGMNASYNPTCTTKITSELTKNLSLLHTYTYFLPTLS